MPGFPANKVVEMSYYKNLFITNVAGTTGCEYVVFRANSIFDPEYATGGNTARGYATWADFYQHYVVLSSTIALHLFANEDAAGNPQIAFAGGSYDATDPIVASNVVLDGNFNYHLCPMWGTRPILRDFADLDYHYDADTAWDLTNAEDAYNNIGASFGANPASPYYFLVGLANYDDSLNNDSGNKLTGYCKITYKVLLSQPTPFEVPNTVNAPGDARGPRNPIPPPPPEDSVFEEEDGPATQPLSPFEDAMEDDGLGD